MLEAKRYVIREQVKFLRTTTAYDIFDGDSQEPLGSAVEIVSSWVAGLRWFISKHVMPSRVEVREKPDDSLVFVLRRGAYLFRSRVEVLDAQGERVGYFKSKVFTLGGGFHAYDRHDQHFAEVKGNWIGFNYRFLTPDGIELGKVSKQWGGLAKELFTSADAYGVEISPEVAHEPISKMLLLAAALAIDMIYKEESRTVSVGDLDG